MPFVGKRKSVDEAAKLERFKAEADTLYNVYLIENAYNVLRRFASGNDPQMLWRLARILCEKAKLSRDKEDKRRFLYDALKMAEKALDNEGEEGCWEAHKWYRPHFYSSNLWYLAEVKARLGKKEESLELYKAAFRMPVLTIDDGTAHDKAYEKLQKLGVKDFVNV
ncbi:unnamed protein product [Gongylonema pulchrum]|uniref:TPR_REGION domain-containing protein n=1 Tax=Gongylonema pulchrum TaxID=637853 RepID=A0A183DX88_9BILA|nr:unnamed protein product [Gongylonema pulchrum]